MKHMISLAPLLRIPSPLPAAFAVLPNLILVSFGKEGGNTSETCLLRLGGGFDLRKLAVREGGEV